MPVLAEALRKLSISPGAIVGLGAAALKVLAIVLIARWTIIFGGAFIGRVFGYLEERKAKTLGALLKSVLRYGVDFLAFLTILAVFDVDTRPVLASAGVLGLAIGFGAQNLVRDVISGFFILFEDQFAVGDHVNLGNVEGIVEETGLRVTVVRDFGGQLHFVPNGSIDRVTNYSRGNMRALVDVSIAYEEDIDKAIAVIEEVNKKLAEELPAIKEGPQVLGVTELGESGVTIQVLARTEPLQQWAVARQLRKRIKEALDSVGIEIPYPKRVILTMGEGVDR